MFWCLKTLFVFDPSTTADVEQVWMQSYWWLVVLISSVSSRVWGEWSWCCDLIEYCSQFPLLKNIVNIYCPSKHREIMNWPFKTNLYCLPAITEAVHPQTPASCRLNLSWSSVSGSVHTGEKRLRINILKYEGYGIL